MSRSPIAVQLTRDEGFETQVYLDSLGFQTIGVGRLVDRRKPGSGLRASEIDFMLENDIEDRVEALRTALPWFDTLDEPRQGVLINMAFQLGSSGLLAFTRTLGYVRTRTWDLAASAMLDSEWAKQTPARAQRLAQQMLTGEWQ
jgi:lysozyme